MVAFRKWAEGPLGNPRAGTLPRCAPSGSNAALWEQIAIAVHVAGADMDAVGGEDRADDGARQRIGRRAAELVMLGVEVAVPVASANTVSPSPLPCAGRIARARPSSAICAILLACALVRRALVATTAMVVARSSSSRQRVGRRLRGAHRGVRAATACSRRRSRRSWRRTTRPAELTATMAPTTTPFGNTALAVPMPPLVPPERAPAPAPTLPIGHRAVVRGAARVHAERRVGAEVERRAAARIEQDRRRHDRHDGAVGHRHADALALQARHHAVGRGQAVGAAAAQHHRVRRADRLLRLQQIGLARARRAAALRDAGGGAAARDDGRGAGHAARCRSLPCSGRPRCRARR